MNQRIPALLCALGAFLFAGCESTQGPVQGSNEPVRQMGKEIEPAPETKSFSGKKDVFQGAEYDDGVGQLPAGAKQIRLRVGQVIEVYRGSFALGDNQYEQAFYLPVEARTVVQLVVETKGLTRTYFLRAIGVGDTVGGVVERRWLDSSGYNPRDAAAEARIQNSIRATPYLISVY